ncbi:MAG: SDR family oxidoreductase [Promethearchaeota archaeon]|nr:MAG: SDR family oxidoreductase [Candidatus Lokiarchaeota archaeon]
MLLKGKNVIITGSGRGIGRAIAIASAKEGANLGLISRTMEEINQTKDIIKSKGFPSKVVINVADVTNYDALAKVFKGFYEELGPFNGVIANAGYSRMWATHEFINEKFSEILDTNILGVFYTFKAAYKFMKKDDKKDKARFIITGSEAYPNAPPRLTAYVASKYAVVGMQKAMASEYKRENINFNMVLPTQVDTRLLRGKKAGDGNKADHVLDPSDLNEYYLFLLSDYANKVDNALIFTYDIKETKKILRDAPENKKDNWDNFQEYLKIESPEIYEKVKNQDKLIDFIITREK